MKLIKFIHYSNCWLSVLLISVLLVTSGCSQNKEYFSSGCQKNDFALSCVLGVPTKVVIPERTDFVKDEVVLLYPSNSNINHITKKYNLQTIDKTVLPSIKTGMILANTQGQNPLHLSKKINQRESDVESGTNSFFKPAAALYRRSFSMYETGVNLVHKTTKGKGTTICMIDTPVDIFHPSLSNSLIETLDLVDYKPEELDTMLHGTSVAGVLVSQNKHIGIAPKAKLFAISAFNVSKNRPHILQGSSANIAKAIDSCIQHNADVINLSFTGGRDSLIKKLVKKAVSKGIIVVAAAGNGGHWGSTIYPAQISGVLAATAVDKNKKLYNMADKGRFIDYAAPGVNVLTIAPGGKYKVVTGTSLSAAHLSGVAALLLSQSKKSNILDQTLSKTALDLGKPGRDQEFGDGLVNASAALNAIKKNK